VHILSNGELDIDGLSRRRAVLCDAKALDFGGDVCVEVLAVGECSEIDIGDAADAGVRGNDVAGGEVEVRDGYVCVEGCCGGVCVIDGAAGAVTGERTSAGDLCAEFEGRGSAPPALANSPLA